MGTAVQCSRSFHCTALAPCDKPVRGLQDIPAGERPWSPGRKGMPSRMGSAKSMSKRARVGVAVWLLALGLGVRPAMAQVDFSGEWAPRFHEDQPERVPGPELGDYLGLPISDTARLRADNWKASIQ